MVLGTALVPMAAVGGLIGYIAWPYLSESKRNAPKNVALDAAGLLMDGDIWTRLISTTGALILVGLIGYTLKVLWTGESGFLPTLARLVGTEVLIIGLSIGMSKIGHLLYDDDPWRFDGGRDDVAEKFGVTTLMLANFAFIPIAASKLALEATDNRKTATVAGIMTLTVSAALTGAYLQYEFVQ